MILRLEDDPHGADSIARRILGGNRSLRSLWRRVAGPSLVVGAPQGYGGELLLRADLDDRTRRQAADTLLDGAQALGRELGASLWFSGVREADDMTTGCLGDRAYARARYLPLTAIDIEWGSFEEYLRWQRQRSARLAKNIRRERARCRDAGVTLIEPKDLDGLGRLFHKLADQTMAKHGGPDLPLRPGFYEAVRKGLGAAHLVCTAVRHGEVIGFVSLVCDGDTVWADSYGLDYAKAEGTFTYFDLTHYWEIEKAIELGLKRVVFGRGQYEARLRRGCHLVDTYIYRAAPSVLDRTLYGLVLTRVDQHYARQARSG